MTTGAAWHAAHISNHAATRATPPTFHAKVCISSSNRLPVQLLYGQRAELLQAGDACNAAKLLFMPHLTATLSALLHLHSAAGPAAPCWPQRPCALLLLCALLPLPGDQPAAPLGRWGLQAAHDTSIRQQRSTQNTSLKCGSQKRQLSPIVAYVIPVAPSPCSASRQYQTCSTVLQGPPVRCYNERDSLPTPHLAMHNSAPAGNTAVQCTVAGAIMSVPETQGALG